MEFGHQVMGRLSDGGVREAIIRDEAIIRERPSSEGVCSKVDHQMQGETRIPFAKRSNCCRDSQVDRM
jgi:hypothetical protein